MPWLSMERMMTSVALPVPAFKSAHVRLATSADAEAIAAIYAPYVADTAISFELAPPDAAEMQARIAKVLAMFPWLVWEAAGGVEGYAYASRHRDRDAYQWSVDVGIYVTASAQRKGVGRALYTDLLPQVAAQGVHSVYAGISLPNAGSIGLHEAMGFRPIGVYREVGYKHGAWHDVGWWGLTLGSAKANPSPPRPWAVS
jgi:L-amino acid N-acyltransferase YncA